jgi:hypothetical protein
MMDTAVYLIDRTVDAATGISDRHALFVHLYVIWREKIECVEAEVADTSTFLWQ